MGIPQTAVWELPRCKQGCLCALTGTSPLCGLGCFAQSWGPSKWGFTNSSVLWLHRLNVCLASESSWGSGLQQSRICPTWRENSHLSFLAHVATQKPSARVAASVFQKTPRICLLCKILWFLKHAWWLSIWTENISQVQRKPYLTLNVACSKPL